MLANLQHANLQTSTQICVCIIYLKRRYLRILIFTSFIVFNRLRYQILSVIAADMYALCTVLDFHIGKVDV